MKIQKLLSLMGFLLLFGPSLQFCKAQSNGNWNPLWVSTTNRFKGVEGFYQLTTCNGAETVLLKFVNYNPYSVKAVWKDMVVTKTNQQLSGNLPQQSVTIGSNSEVKGDCTSNTIQLVRKLSDFGVTGTNFQALIANNFDVIAKN